MRIPISDLLFINVEELFKSLKIPCSNVLEGTSLEGSIGNGRESYLLALQRAYKKWVIGKLMFKINYNGIR
jgi:hypothetical protein